MSTEHSDSASTAHLNYEQFYWGEVITGTKEQLQSLGIGVGRAFPDEPGGNRRKFSVRDPRGYIVEIERRNNDAGIYLAKVRFPNVPVPPKAETVVAFPGVKMVRITWGDQYTGSAQDLVAAGLVRHDQLPGMPGMRTTRVTIFADGSLPGGPICSPLTQRAKEPGARCVERASKLTYRVTVVISKIEQVLRYHCEDVNRRFFEHQVRGLPRPAKLQPMPESKRLSLEAAQASAARDMGFQGFLARIVAAAGRPAA